VSTLGWGETLQANHAHTPAADAAVADNTVCILNPTTDTCYATPTVIVVPDPNCKLDVCFLLDASSSMLQVPQTGPPLPWDVAKRVVLNALNRVGHPESHIVVSQFSTLYQKIAQGKPADVPTITTAVLNAGAVGLGNSMAPGIRGCMSDLDPFKNGNMWVIVLLTDGGSDDSDATNTAAAEAKAQPNLIHIVTVGVGNTVDKAFLDFLNGLSSSGSTVTADAFTTEAVATLGMDVGLATCAAGEGCY
jgi:hypothetical protein